MGRHQPVVFAACMLLLSLATGGTSLAGEGDGGFEDEFEFLEQEEVVFSASRHKQEITESPSAVTVITREQIAHTHCTDLICLLRMVPEVTVRRIVPMYTSVGARALTTNTGDKVLLLVDGRDVNIEYFGLPLWQALPVHLEDIERIEVVRGPVSALYGANAHSLVVSITTRTVDARHAELFAAGGEHDRNAVHLRAGARIGKWELQVTGGYETAGHWRLQGVRQRELGRIRLRFDRRERGSDSRVELGLVTPQGSVYTAMSPTEIRDTQLAHMIASHRSGPLRLQLSGNLASTTFEADLPFIYQGIKMGEIPPAIKAITGSLDAAPQITIEPFDGNLLVSGCNYRWVGFHSEGNDPENLHEHRFGLFFHDEQRLGEDLVLTGGVRLDYNNLTPFTVSPRLAGVWRFAAGQFLRASFGQAFRRPAFFNTHVHYRNVRTEPGFEELEEFFQRSFGNPDLGNEEISAIEAGYRGRFLDARLAIDLEVFFQMHRDTINFFWDIAMNELGMPDLGDSTIEYRNGGREVNTLGGSASIVYRHPESLRLGLNATYRYSWFISQPSGSMDVAGARGDRVPWEPVLLFNAFAGYATASGLHLGLALHLASAYEEFMPEQGGVFDPLVAQRLPPVLFTSGYIAWRLPWDRHRLELGMRAFNMFHAGLYESGSVQRPDGNVVGGMRLSRRVLLFLRAAY